MRLCLIGKFPPIQGGVSARMYRLAHALAGRGHQVHVVTNAMEVEDGYRVSMRPEDYDRLAARHGDGYVRVHHTVSDVRSQWHVPWHNPYATKLAGLAIDVIRNHELECVFSWYLEPYGVAGHLAASFTDTPHVVKTAGSDVGRLWQQPGMRTLYDELFLAADVIIGGGPLLKGLAELGVRPERIVPGDTDAAFVPLDEFAPEGDVLALDSFGGRDVTTVGIFGKLGRFKGMLPLLRAVRECLEIGKQMQVAAMVQGRPEDERAFGELLRELHLDEHVIRVPFLPHWRVPEFLRACDVVCCLEQDFPIRAHAPIIAQEALAVGRPTLLSQEIAAKQPEAHRLVHGYNCWIVRDSADHDEIVRSLLHVIANPSALEVGVRGRVFAEYVQTQSRFPAAHEAAMQLAIDGVRPDEGAARAAHASGEHGLLELLDTIRRRVSSEAALHGVTLPTGSTPEADWFRAAGAAFAAARAGGIPTRAEQAIQLALQLFETQRDVRASDGEGLFRLEADAPCWQGDEVAEYRPSLAPGVTARTYAGSPMDMLLGADQQQGESEVVVVVLPFSARKPVKLYVLSGPAADLVTASDGHRTLAGLTEFTGRGNGDSRQSILELAEALFALGVLQIAAPAASGTRNPR